MLAAGLIALVPTSAQPADATLGASVDGLRAAGRQLSPALRAAALEADAAAAKADGADALDDPTISDSYQSYRDPGVFSAHTVTLTQAFPLWGKRDLRREAALADVDAARGRERTAQDEIDEKIKVAFAEYYVITRSIAVNKEVGGLARRMQAAAEARYGQGSGEQAFVIQTIGEDTTAKVEAIRLDGEKSAARARLNALVGRPAGAALAEPAGVRPMPATEPNLSVLLDRARTANPTLS
ncbi:MAG TPA: TolC family protein, partial [Inquilinus sp.]|nr:TolC family protein [Inquilinus sp.]